MKIVVIISRVFGHERSYFGVSCMFLPSYFSHFHSKCHQVSLGLLHSGGKCDSASQFFFSPRSADRIRFLCSLLSPGDTTIEPLLKWPPFERRRTLGEPPPPPPRPENSVQQLGNAHRKRTSRLGGWQKKKKLANEGETRHNLGATG